LSFKIHASGLAIAEMVEGLSTQTLSRRNLLKSGALLGGSALVTGAVAGTADNALGLLRQAEAATPPGAYPLAKPEHVIYSVCLQCHTACPIKVKILDGVAVKIDGNPYSAQNMIPNLKQNGSPWGAARIDAKLCPKGQAGVQSLYDPYRIVKVLKRAGPRGSNKWRAIPFDQAVDEIVNGGQLFKEVGEDRQVDGFKDLYKLRDAGLAKRMAKDAARVATRKMSVAAFKQRYRAHLDLLIDPDHPDLGPINNQFVMQSGRIEHGRKEFAKRFVKGAFGSVNVYEHTTICEQSHHIAYKQATRQFEHGRWGKPHSEHMKPDAMNSEFIIYFGTGFVEANFGPTNMAEKVTDGLASGRLKVAVVDPRMSLSAAKAWKWLAVKPGTDGALPLAMIRWIIDQRRYDDKFLRAANKAAAKRIGETSWTNASHLVKIEADGPGACLRASEVGVGGNQLVVMHDGQPTAVGDQALDGTLEFSGEVKGIQVKTAFTLLKEEAFSRDLAAWSELCGIPQDDIVAVAREFTAHGKKAAADMYRGAVKHTNGYYNAQAVIALNMLVGSIDHIGGLSDGGGHWHEDGSKLKKPFHLKSMHPGALHAFGPHLTREGSRYEDSTLFNGYPAKRPWFPFTGNVYQEIIPSAADGYPYPIKALWVNMGSPALSVPAANEQLKVLADPARIPLVLSTDIVVGETSMYADYVFPDAAIWERWGSPHTSPDVVQRASKFRQPTITPLTEVVEAFGEKQHCLMEAVMLAIAERLGLSGFGKDGLGKGHDLTRPEDWYLKMAANLAWGDKGGDAVPDASRAEMKLFANARTHLKKTVFNPTRWEQAAGSGNWLKVVHLLNRGGRWEDWKTDFTSPGMQVHLFAKQFNIYAEAVALQRHSLTGKRFSGVPIHEPIMDAGGHPIDDRDFPLQLSTYKHILGGQSRTLPANYWMSSILPENYILINVATAAKFGFKDGDKARLVSATNDDGKWHLPNRGSKDMVGKIKAVQGMRPGVVSVSWHFGHWGYGASDTFIDGQRIPADKRRATGLCPNAVLRADPVLKNVCMTDPIGGSASYFDTRIKLLKVA